MWSKNKAKPTKDESHHIELIKGMDCVVCNASGPCDAHEIKQGQWFTSIPLCKSCHQSPFNGIHGQARIWDVLKMDELSALNETIRRILN